MSSIVKQKSLSFNSEPTLNIGLLYLIEIVEEKGIENRMCNICNILIGTK